MNRIEELERLNRELEESAPSLAPSVERARRRRNRRRRILAPVSGLAAAFVLFVGLVNFSLPVAYACAGVPFLRELAQAVTFSRSLRDAVDNEFVQPMQLEETKNGVTARVEHLIVDRKQVNVFFRLNSGEYDQLRVEPEVLDDRGERPACCSYGFTGNFQEENGALRHMDIDFGEGEVPDRLHLVLKVWNDSTAPLPPMDSDPLWEHTEWEPDYLAEFDFLLKFDPQFTQTGEQLPVDQTVAVDGQQLTVTGVEIYPTHMRIQVEESPDNTAELKGLDFYIEADGGEKRFEAASRGIISSGTLDRPNVTAYRADSSYFHRAEQLKLVITGAAWLDKNRERIHMDLTTGRLEDAPMGVTAEKPVRRNGGWELTFRAPIKDDAMYAVFGGTYYDPEGTQYQSDSLSTWYDTDSWDEEREVHTHAFESFPLRDYPYEEVWLTPSRSREVTLETPVTVDLR